MLKLKMDKREIRPLVLTIYGAITSRGPDLQPMVEQDFGEAFRELIDLQIVRFKMDDSATKCTISFDWEGVRELLLPDFEDDPSITA